MDTALLLYLSADENGKAMIDEFTNPRWTMIEQGLSLNHFGRDRIPCRLSATSLSLGGSNCTDPTGRYWSMVRNQTSGRPLRRNQESCTKIGALISRGFFGA
jgi:hypothetical protein